MEMDLVAHCGDVNRGSYINSLVVADIATGWTEAAPLVVREGSLVVETIERIRASLPFNLCALDVDNASEFVNEMGARSHNLSIEPLYLATHICLDCHCTQSSNNTGNQTRKRMLSAPQAHLPRPIHQSSCNQTAPHFPASPSAGARVPPI
jgi:hypothetical protein